MADNKPAVEVTDEAKEKAKEMASAYDDRPTSVLPSSERTMTGTAVSEWLDEDGNSKFADGKDADGNEVEGKGSGGGGGDSKASSGEKGATDEPAENTN